MADPVSQASDPAAQIVRPPKQARSQETLHRIAQAALELMEEGGVENATVSAIVNRAGASVGSFYARFKGKDDLIRYLQDRIWSKLGAEGDAYWMADASGATVASGGLNMRTRDLAHVGRISHIPGVIVQGRYDMICPPNSAYRLAELWPACELKMIRNAGHALSEPGISAELVRTMDQIAEEVL